MNLYMRYVEDIDVTRTCLFEKNSWRSFMSVYRVAEDIIRRLSVEEKFK